MMTTATDPAESADPVEFTLSPDPAQGDSGFIFHRLESANLHIQMRLSVVRGLTADVLAAGDAETNGILLGRREPGDPDVLWIDRFERLDTAPEVWPAETLGFYRGTGAKTGFSDSSGLPEGLFLEVFPASENGLTGRFFVSAGDSGAGETRGGVVFPFAAPEHAAHDANEKQAPHAKPRRIVPDFEQAQANILKPGAREFFLQPRNVTEQDPEPGLVRKFGPFIAALALIAGAIWLLPQMISPSAPSPAPKIVTARRPVGLYVDPSQPAWRISWNRDASVLQGARVVRLFINDLSTSGDEGQNGIDLSEKDLESGMYAYTPDSKSTANDVTFRLEATSPDGLVSAETFRLMRTIPAVQGAPKTEQTPPKVTHRVAPVISAGIRPKIRGKVGIDIRALVDTRGRVSNVTPLTKPKNSVERILIRSAEQAARQWRFEPATKAGKPVTGSQTLHFVFER
jgi:hypothetical protein